jgi:hypothetical protein
MNFANCGEKSGWPRLAYQLRQHGNPSFTIHPLRTSAHPPKAYEYSITLRSECVDTTVGSPIL